LLLLLLSLALALLLLLLLLVSLSQYSCCCCCCCCCFRSLLLLTLTLIVILMLNPTCYIVVVGVVDALCEPRGQDPESQHWKKSNKGLLFQAFLCCCKCLTSTCKEERVTLPSLSVLHNPDVKHAACKEERKGLLLLFCLCFLAPQETLTFSMQNRTRKGCF